MELERLLATAPEDVTRCCEIAREIGELRCRELVRLVRSTAEVRASLTPEQRDRLAKVKF